MSPRVDVTDAREGWSRVGSLEKGERRDGRPFTGACAWDAELGLNELEYGVSRRPTGDDRGGKPVGDVLCFAKSRPNCDRPVSSGTAKLALVSTGELVGDSFGKRVAADEGDGTARSDDAVLGLLWCVCVCACVLSESAAGFVGAGGPGPWPLGLVPPIAS